MQTKTYYKGQAIKYIVWTLGISWIYGYAVFVLIEDSGRLFIYLLQVLCGFVPAIIALIANHKEGGTWKNLKFIKPTLKGCILAIIIPLIYFGLKLAIEVYSGIKTVPDWSMVNAIPSYIFGLCFMLFAVFGEEIGWRGYLQEKLINGFGEITGITILGLVWAFWHLPIILNGSLFPNHPILGTFIAYPLGSIAISFLIAYLGFNKYSIYIAVILHSVHNTIYFFFEPITQINNSLEHRLVEIAFSIVGIIVFGTAYWRKKRFTTTAIANRA